MTAGHEADQSLRALAEDLRAAAHTLQGAADRADSLLARRQGGASWSAVMGSEPRPLIVELVSGTLDGLTRSAGTWRRANARAMHDEGLTMDRIAALYGVTRQRVSALLQSAAPVGREVPRLPAAPAGRRS